MKRPNLDSVLLIAFLLVASLSTVYSFFQMPLLGPNQYVCDVRLIHQQAGHSNFHNCYGDVDGNGVVNAGDRGFIAVNINSNNADNICLYDLDGNGIINPGDRGYVGPNIGLCTPLPLWQNGAGIGPDGNPDSRFEAAESCGDNVATESEVCDGLDLKGNSCELLGFDSGQLACDSGCHRLNVDDCSYKQELKQFILIGVDGMQNSHLESMLAAGELPNISSLISMGGKTTANITKHAITATMPGNAELHTGLGEDITFISRNICGNVLPDGLTTFERLKQANENIATGSIYGKEKCYVPLSLLNNSLPEIDWFKQRKPSDYEYTQWPDSTYCAYATNVSTKAREFISANADNSFYLVVYFGEPDCSGHAAGDNSENYNASFRSVDQGVGIILDALENNSLSDSVGIILTADHGWIENDDGHDQATLDTLLIPLVTNRASLIQSPTTGGIREQCEVAPTIMNFIGIPRYYYSDVLDYGCESMYTN